MGIGVYERLLLEGEKLEQSGLILGGAPPLRGVLADLGISLRHACDVATLAIYEADKPGTWNVTHAE